MPQVLFNSAGESMAANGLQLCGMSSGRACGGCRIAACSWQAFLCVQALKHQSMVTIDFDGPIEEYHKTGIYFKSESHQCMHYLVSFSVQHDGQCKASIFTIGIPQRNGREFSLEIGSDIAVISTEQHVMDIDIWGKYYFPEFMSQQQWYHDTGKEDYIASLAEVMRFALAKGLEFGKITPY